MSTPTPATPVSTTATDALSVALVSLLGPWGALAALAYKFGSPFVAKLIANAHANADPTVDEWTALDKEIDTPGEVLIPPRPPVPTTPTAGASLIPPRAA